MLDIKVDDIFHSDVLALDDKLVHILGRVYYKGELIPRDVSIKINRQAYDREVTKTKSYVIKSKRLRVLEYREPLPDRRYPTIIVELK